MGLRSSLYSRDFPDVSMEMPHSPISHAAEYGIMRRTKRLSENGTPGAIRCSEMYMSLVALGRDFCRIIEETAVYHVSIVPFWHTFWPPLCARRRSRARTRRPR